MTADTLVTLMPGSVAFFVCAPWHSKKSFSETEKKHEKNNRDQTRGSATLCAAGISACAAADTRRTAVRWNATVKPCASVHAEYKPSAPRQDSIAIIQDQTRMHQLVAKVF